jgi:hypothetical protein
MQQTPTSRSRCSDVSTRGKMDDSEESTREKRRAGRRRRSAPRFLSDACLDSNEERSLRLGQRCGERCEVRSAQMKMMMMSFICSCSGPGAARTILLFIPLVLGPLNSLVWYVPSLRYMYTRGQAGGCTAVQSLLIQVPINNIIIKQKIGAELIYLEEGTYHQRLFRGPNTNDMKK